MEAKKTYFSKDDTSVMKGIAILLMMLHHCFMSADRFTGYRIRFLPFGKARVMRVAAYSKICVAIFVFLSAYGLTFIIKKMWNSDSFKFKDIRKFYINRYISLISGYFVIVIGSLVIAQLIDGRTYESFFKGKSTFVGIRNIILNILGIQEWFDLSDFCGTWWYMSLAVIIILLLPLFYYLVKKTRWNYLVITAVLMFATILVCYKRFVKFIKIFSSKHAYQNMTNWLVIVLIGMLFADEDILESNTV